MSAPPAQSLVLSFEDARRVVEEHAAQIAPGASECVDLLHASGRILAEPITADRDIPPFPRSTRDGYAVRSRGPDEASRAANRGWRDQSGAEPESNPFGAKSRPGFFDHDRSAGASGRGRGRNGGIHVFAVAE